MRGGTLVLVLAWMVVMALLFAAAVGVHIGTIIEGWFV